MDNVFQPDGRKWISPVTNLGEAMAEVKRLVQMKRETVVVIEPIASSFQQSQDGNGSRSFDDLEDQRDYMRSGARNLEPQDLITEEDSSRDDFTNQWSRNDEICAAAVAFVGGSDLFVVEKKEKKKKKGAGGKQKKTRRRKGKDADDEDSNTDEEPEDVNMEEEQKTLNHFNTKPQEKQRRQGSGARMSSDSQRLSLSDPQPSTSAVTYNNNMDFGLVSSTKLKVEETPTFIQLPGEMDSLLFEPNDIHNLNISEIDFLDLDNENDNFASAADRYDTYRELRPDLIGSDSEDSDKENDSTDEEEVSETISSRRTRIKTENAAESPIPGSSQQDPDSVKLSDIRADINAAEEEKSAGAGFKDFSNWVFDRTKSRDALRRRQMKGDMMKVTNLPDREVSCYQKITSTTLATVKGEVYQDEPVMKSSSMPLLAPEVVSSCGANLQSLSVFIVHGEEPSYFPWKSMNVQQQMNDDFTHDEFLTRMEQQKKDLVNPALKDQLVDKEEDFVVHLLIYQATDPEDAKLPDEAKISTEPKLAYELMVLGSQTVKDLVNVIYCDNDYLYMKDVPHPENFTVDNSQFAKQQFPSSIILINDTVYNDPGSGNKDYGAILSKWSQTNPNKGIGPFKTADWNTEIKDLNLRFGFPYVFIHLGGCEHIFVFTKARHLHTEDHHLMKDYPKINGISRFKNVYCRVDNEYLARWAVLDFKEFPENPMLLCTECVLMYCYDDRKRKRGNFRLYPFTQIANMI